MNLYQILEVSEQAGSEQIKQAYRRLAKKYHPDLNPGNAEADKRFRDIADAYEILGNSDKRKEYDKNLKYGSADNQNQKASGQNGPDWGSTPEQMMGNFTKDMEAYFGFSFSQEKKMDKGHANAPKTNPLDVNEMFEAFMKMK